MSGFNPNTSAAPDQVYEWRYEYYDDEEPVSFVGLKAHRYSIVIGFWVGLAVFVIFMFFVLTLLTKTGAPHPDGADPCVKRDHPASCMELATATAPARARLPRPLLDSSGSLLHCYINEEERRVSGPGAGVSGAPLGGRGRPGSPEGGSLTGRETVLLAHFNIPNFVNSEHSSMLGDDDLLLGGPSIILAGDCLPNSDRIP